MKKTNNIISGPGRKVPSRGGTSVVHGFAIGWNDPAGADVSAYEVQGRHYRLMLPVAANRKSRIMDRMHGC